MGDNLMREGENKSVSFKSGGYDRTERLKELGFDLPIKPGAAFDQLLEMAEQLKEAQEHFEPRIRKEREELRDKESALGLKDGNR